MRVVLTEESHNHVDWETKSPVVWIELGLLVGAVAMCLLVWSSPSAWRWYVIAAIAAVAIGAGGVLAATTPRAERGHLERLPEGSDLKRTKVWLIAGERTSVDLVLDDVEEFEVEVVPFEDVPPTIYRLARLWALTKDGSRHSLTDWADPDSIDVLSTALQRASRLEAA